MKIMFIKGLEVKIFYTSFIPLHLARKLFMTYLNSSF